MKEGEDEEEREDEDYGNHGSHLITNGSPNDYSEEGTAFIDIQN